jgi:hypothetical protein
MPAALELDDREYTYESALKKNVNIINEATYPGYGGGEPCKSADFSSDVATTFNRTINLYGCQLWYL